MTNFAEHPTDELAAGRCWERLREAAVARLAVIVDDHPDVFPVNYVIDHDTIVFRTAEGTKLAASLSHPVALEIDGFDEATGEAWSVVARGAASRITQFDDILRATSLPLYPWHGGLKGVFVRIAPDSLTGRSFPIADPQSWYWHVTHREVRQYR